MERNEGRCILALDPGREKCGLAVLHSTGSIIEKLVVATPEMPDATGGLARKYHPVALVVGGGTGSETAYKAASEISPGSVVRVSEEGTTLEARELAWRENPPGGIWRLIPRIFWPTPPDLDAWAAVVIGRRALAELELDKPAA
jgi:hypothetical protein